MSFCFSRLGPTLVVTCCVAALFAAEPTRRTITATEMAALKEPINVGKGVYIAVCRYYSNRESRAYPAGPALFTDSPTIELLHAVGYIADADMQLIQRYRIGIPTVIVKPTDPVVIMQTKSGELTFDTRGQITLLDKPGP